ncbi:HET-domain-containing protein [Jackrogersella minutella]|nr:HET-domain-containing protein [Jackrogersella minutella]
MRLIDVNTLELKEFFGSQTPQYAILSHTWDGDKEVTFQEWERRTDSAVMRKDGYAKIVGACRRAQADGLRYLWCDTNCIDKRSSAELSEAINSMFAWYHDSVVCYAYLADVHAKMDTFAKSRWFTRGWTLQELLAPSKVIFFDYSWTVLGDRGELAGMIMGITRIHIGALKDRSMIHDYSIAQRMSWAADRHTSRYEDIAYCLLGIFGINMPLLYGEGHQAFKRLQQEIIKVSDDQSILAWDLQSSDACSLTSALAPSPVEFRFCGSIIRHHETQQSSYFIINLGISLKLALFRTLQREIVLVGLNCAKELHRKAPTHPRLPNGAILQRHFRVWIPLRQYKHDTFARTHHPSSKIFLQNSYSTIGRPVSTKLFLSLDAFESRVGHSLENPVEILQRNAAHSSSGILVAVASGRISPHGHILREVYPLNGISVIHLKRQGASTISHQLVSSGNLSTIFSVFWNKDRLAEEWCHTTIFDPGLKVSSQMTSQTEWSCLFEARSHEQSTPCCNNAVAMRLLHQKLLRVHGSPLSTYAKEEKDPIVITEYQPWKDSFENQELIVEIVFRDTPGSTIA